MPKSQLSMDGNVSGLVRGLEAILVDLEEFDRGVVQGTLASAITTGGFTLSGSIASSILGVVNDYARSCSWEVPVRVKEEVRVAQWSSIPDIVARAGQSVIESGTAPVGLPDARVDPDPDGGDVPG